VDASDRAPGQASRPQPAGLTERSLATDPITQFSRWLGDAIAAGLPEPTAMVLASASPEAVPRARTVLLKGYDSAGFTFFTNKTSRKGRELGANPRACLLFPWHAMHRQVIVEGAVAEVSAEQNERYFHSRAHGSQLGAWASRQSSVLTSRGELDDRYARLGTRWPKGTDVPLPPFWGGYLVIPAQVEFWQGRANRMHDRLRYRRGDDGWVVERLSP
jgi:pyridoxamine 5'-phosphate oxidase